MVFLHDFHGESRPTSQSNFEGHVKLYLNPKVQAYKISIWEYKKLNQRPLETVEKKSAFNNDTQPIFDLNNDIKAFLGLNNDKMQFRLAKQFPCYF